MQPRGPSRVERLGIDVRPLAAQGGVGGVSQAVTRISTRRSNCWFSRSSITRSTCSTRPGTVTSWNAGAERIKGYAPDEIIGKHFSLFYTEEDRAAGIPAHALETAAREGKYESEAWRVRKDGKHVPGPLLSSTRSGANPAF